MKKRNKVLIILLAAIAATLISNAKITPIMSAVPSEPKNADAMWIEPSIVNVTGLSIGYRFNVTVWINVSIDCLAWQFQMLYDKSMVKAVAAGYTGTGGLRSEFFENAGTTSLFPLPPTLDVFYDATRNYVLHGEAWSPMIPNNPNATGVGSLSWVEFEVIAEPPAGQILTTEIDISTPHHPP
ncbi:MAG: hypothetical protein OEZ40_09760, partial [Candidatus Bathyarchaeota archaeon]|nr:hypothetical protein [Candidatus Bathyarchaeota archaeon]